MTGQNSGKISSCLEVMVDRKIIDKISKKQLGGIYTIVAQLFKLWLQTNVLFFLENECHFFSLCSFLMLQLENGVIEFYNS